MSIEHIKEETQRPPLPEVFVPELPEARNQPRSFEVGELPSFEFYAKPAAYGVVASVVESLETPLAIKTVAKSAGVDADFALPAHAVFKQSGENAVLDLAASIADEMGEDVRVSIESRFINIKFDERLMARHILSDVARFGDSYGHNDDGAGQTVVLDVSSPNIAKEMHLGHLRSTVIGEALARIMQANGYTAIRDNHIGDWGTQFGILAHAYQLWHDEIPELDQPETQVAGLQKLYVRINAAITAEKEASENKKTSALENEGRSWFTRLEEGDADAHKLWKWASDLSMAEFEKVYAFLGVDFEYVLGESVYADASESVYRAYHDRGIAQYDDLGRLRLIPGGKGIPPLTLQKSDGSSLYGTRDLAALSARMAWFNPSKILYVFGNEQKDYFRQFADGFEQFAGDDAPEVRHIGFGMIELPEGKMSTRRGNVVFLNDLIQEVYQKALVRVTENAEVRNMSMTEEELAEIAHQETVAAIIYYDLKQSADRKIIFNWDEALSFQGNTGPFLQYTHARMNALLKSYDLGRQDLLDENTALEHLNLEGTEGELIQLLGDFPNVVKYAAEKYEPSIISEYSYKLAHAFNIYYTEFPILKETDPQIRVARIHLVNATRQVLRNSLRMLNIPMPDRL